MVRLWEQSEHARSALHPKVLSFRLWVKKIGRFPQAQKGGAAYVTRTRDPIITNDVLYQLS